jgi:hypothetical protein
VANLPPAEAELAILGPVSDLAHRVEIYESDGITPWKGGTESDRLVTGQVTIDYSRDERRAFDVELDNSDFGLIHAPDEFWYDKVLKIYSGVKYISTDPIISTSVRVNLCHNPKAGTSTAGYGATGSPAPVYTGSRITGSGCPAADTAFRTTFTANTTAYNTGPYYLMPVGNMVLIGNAVHAARFWVRSSKKQRINPVIAYYNDSTVQVGSGMAGTPITIEANTWSQLDIVGWPAPPSGATRIMVFVRNESHADGSLWLNGDTIDITAITIEETDIAPNTFNGDTPDFANRTYDWLGTPNLSHSTETITTSTPTGYVETTWDTQVGEFMIDSIQESHFPYVVKVSGRDYTKKCLVSKFTATTSFAAAATIESVIKSIAMAAGVTKFQLPLTGKTLAKAYFFERGVARWEAMKEIADAYGYELFFDAQGYLVMREFLDPTTSPIAYTLQTGQYGNMTEYEKSLNDSRIYNHIVVTGESADDSIIPVSAQAINNNPSSPTRIAKMGDRVYQYTSSFITTTLQAQDVANKFLKIHALEEFDLNFGAIALPWLEVGEIIQFLDPRAYPGQPDKFLLTSVTLPLSLGPMSGTAKRVSIVV